MSAEIEQHITENVQVSPTKITAYDANQKLPSEGRTERMSAQDFFRRGPKAPQVAGEWPGTMWDRDMLYDEHPRYLRPAVRPTAAQFAAALKALAATEAPARDYPDDFFSREVIYGG